jgi:hypothetical protein
MKAVGINPFEILKEKKQKELKAKKKATQADHSFIDKIRSSFKRDVSRNDPNVIFIFV